MGVRHTHLGDARPRWDWVLLFSPPLAKPIHQIERRLQYQFAAAEPSTAVEGSRA